MQIQPLATELGVLNGRDAIYLDRLVQEGSKLTLSGEINGSLCEVASEAETWIRYEMVFAGVLAYECTELEVAKWRAPASLCEVHDSEWTRQLGCNKPLRHFLVQTYDYWYSVASSEYVMQILGRRR